MCLFIRSKNNHTASECGESCRQRRRELESEVHQLRREVKSGEERLRTMENEMRRFQQQPTSPTPPPPPPPSIAQQQQQQAQHNEETERLMLKLSALRDKTNHLETSLSAETRVKLDLFSALGDAKKQLEHRESKFTAS